MKSFPISKLHIIELVALLIFIIAALILLTNWLTICLAIVGAIFFVIYLLLIHRHNKFSTFFYS